MLFPHNIRRAIGNTEEVHSWLLGIDHKNGSMLARSLRDGGQWMRISKLQVHFGTPVYPHCPFLLPWLKKSLTVALPQLS